MERHLKSGRNYQMDNIKCLLIFSVVFGHMLELFMGKSGPDRALYLVIYSFHMPLFAFVSGAFAGFDPVRIKNRMIYPYLVFQTFYILFANHVLGTEISLQYTTPYWLLWYLFATVAWNLALPLVEADSTGKKLTFLGAAFAAAVLIGFDNKAGYYLSFSRIVEFFPFFLMGYYSRDLKESARRRIGVVQSHRLKIFLAVGCMLFISLAVGVISANEDDIRSLWLYGSSSYEKADYGWQLRTLCMAVATGWLGFFITVVPVRRIPLLSNIGANTMTIYLLHGFVIRFLKMKKIFRLTGHPMLLAFLLTGILLLMLSADPIKKLLRPFTDFDALKRAAGGNFAGIGRTKNGRGFLQKRGERN